MAVVTQAAIFLRIALCLVEIWKYLRRFWRDWAPFVRGFPMHGAARMWTTRWRILVFRRFLWRPEETGCLAVRFSGNIR